MKCSSAEGKQGDTFSLVSYLSTGVAITELGSCLISRIIFLDIKKSNS